MRRRQPRSKSWAGLITHTRLGHGELATRHAKVGFGFPGTRQATFQSTCRILASVSSFPIFLLSSIALLEGQLTAAFGQLGAFHRMSSRSIQRAKFGLFIPLAGWCGDFAIDPMGEVR